MKSLIPIDSLKYKRRLVRKLNREYSKEGFVCEVYHHLSPGRATRCFKARICKGDIQVLTSAGYWFRMTSPTPWDTNGIGSIAITASRNP